MRRCRNRTSRLERFGRATLAVAILCHLPSWHLWAQSAPTPAARADFNIPAGSLSAALDQFSTQTGIQTLSQLDQLAGKQVGALSGEMTWREALGRLLQGSGLEYQQINATTVIIRPAGPRTKSGASPAAVPSSSKPSTAEKSAVTNLSTMTVTGTRIRGGTTPSPVITIGQENIQEEGFTDLGAVVRSVPQNFAGGQNPGVAGGAGLGGMANQNLTGASALNLRGLGPDATLTLLNGRRLTYNGYAQAVDVSAIPVEAVERIEIVPDGASAIYGSDAVGGVANVLLRRDFDGVTLGTRYGTASEGGLTTREYNATAGTTWASGGLIATWMKSSSDPIFADQRSYTKPMSDPNTIYPGIDTSSGLLSAHQALGDVAELRVDALRTHREQAKYTAYSSYYYYYPYDASIWLLSPSIEFYLPHDWSLTVGGAYGKDETDSTSYYVDSSGKTALDSTCYCNDSRSYEISAEGPLFPLNGGDARLAAGIGTRSESFKAEGSTTRIAGDDSSRYAYLEFNMPFISPASTYTGVHRLELNAAVRGEDYDSFGRVVTPKFGIIYDPNADITFKASWGRSYKAPTLDQRNETKSAYLWTASQVGGSGYPSDATALMSYGGNSDLKPERARTWSASIAFHPESIPGLETELTWFGIDYTDRVVLPLVPLQALSNSSYAPYVDHAPTAEKQAALLAAYHDEFINYADADYDPSKVIAILSDQYVNAARQHIQGVDLSSSYRMALAGGSLTIRGSASKLTSSQQTNAEQPRYDLAGTIFNPAKYKARAGAVWTRNGFSASSFINYTSPVTSKLIAGASEKTSSYTTIDATLRYAAGQRDALSGWEFALSVENLLNRDPPFYTVTSATNPPFDSTNYSAIGRYINLAIAKHW